MIPVFELVINDQETSDVEVQAVALVDKPAIERNFLAFNDQKICFTTIPDKQIVLGPAMIPDMLIYRRDQSGEYNVFFSKETIAKIALKFFKKGYEKNINLFHDQSLSSDKVTIFQTFVYDKSMGVEPMKGYEDLPEGTWFIGAKIEDPAIWQMVLDGQIKGFSVEGIFSYQKKQKHVSEALEALRETLNTECHFTESDLMTVKEMFAKFKEEFKDFFIGEPAPAQTLAQEVTLKDGSKATVDKLEPGGVMMVGDAPCAAGEYELADGTKVTVSDGGLIANIVPPMAAAAEPNQYESQFKEINEKFASYEQKFQAYEQRFVETEGKLNKANETIVALVGIVEKLSEMPTADPVAKTFSKTDSKEAKRQELIQIFQKIKNK